LEEKLTKLKEQNQKYKTYVHEQKQITEKANEVNKMKTKENETAIKQ
jgi:hypothetical protein